MWALKIALNYIQIPSHSSQCSIYINMLRFEVVISNILAIFSIFAKGLKYIIGSSLMCKSYPLEEKALT